MVTTGSGWRVTGGSLQYPSVGFMPLIMISSEVDTTLTVSSYTQYDSSFLTITSTFYTVDSLAVSRIEA